MKVIHHELVQKKQKRRKKHKSIGGESSLVRKEHLMFDHLQSNADLNAIVPKDDTKQENIEAPNFNQTTLSGLAQLE